jgi:CO/xanthine dehydrogenase Mo-binding subunit
MARPVVWAAWQNQPLEKVLTLCRELLEDTTFPIEGMRVFTNKPPCGPKRGHGTPQPRFALEVHLDKIAADLGISPVHIRRSHVVKPFSKTVNHLRITSCAADTECLPCLRAAILRVHFHTRSHNGGVRRRQLAGVRCHVPSRLHPPLRV